MGCLGVGGGIAGHGGTVGVMVYVDGVGCWVEGSRQDWALLWVMGRGLWGGVMGW